jgi:predicted DNA-binding transcriptional regulator AlpA
MSEAPRLETYLAWPQAQPLLGGICRTTAWKGAKEGWLPAPKVISPGRRAYALSDILAWQAAKRTEQAA